MIATVAILNQFGLPAKLELHQRRLADPVDDELLVAMRYAPINPADLNVLEGRYPKTPDLPGVPGNEGVGIVIAAGPKATIPVGTPVIAPGTLGAWATHRLLRSSQLIALPNDVDLQQAAMLTVNPPTAARVLSDFVELKADDWVVVNAANSGVGRWFIRLAVDRGCRVGAVVRRAELAAELTALGATVVATEAANPDALRSAMGGARARLALNMVGGDSATGLLKCLGRDGVHVTCGAMGREPMSVGAAALIFKNVQIRGYWHTAAIEADWADGAGPASASVRSLYQALARRLEPALHVPIADVHPLAEINTAVTAAALGGKHLVQLDA